MNGDGITALLLALLATLMGGGGRVALECWRMRKQWRRLWGDPRN